MIYMTGWTSTNIAPAISAGPEAEALIEYQEPVTQCLWPKGQPGPIIINQFFIFS